MNIFIIGAGRIGSAMQYVLEDYNPVVWDSDVSKCGIDVDCDVELARADVILLCCPTAVHELLAQRILMCARKDAVVISLAKGLSPDGKTVPDILSGVLGDDVIGVLCGPMMAEEILLGKPSFAVIATRNEYVAATITSVFESTSLSVLTSGDVDGVAWLSVMKNVYATLMGVMEALDLGCNMRGFLMTEIARESVRLIQLLGGHADTWFGPAGIGDLVCTVTSPHSRNRSFGEALIHGREAIPGEGVIAMPFLQERLGERFGSFLLLVALERIIAEPTKAKQLLEDLI